MTTTWIVGISAIALLAFFGMFAWAILVQDERERTFELEKLRLELAAKHAERQP